jgi:histidyl-tRNA synthetase
MVYEHEIPLGSKLYFGESAKMKREIESLSATMLEDLGFEEIVTPLFSYHQHESFANKRPLVRLNDHQNNEVTLRADSTVDVVRIVTKRLGRSSASKRWFYIQPTVTFPTKEQYQVGAEILDGKITEVAQTTIKLLEQMEMKPTMQLANIAIPHLLNEKYGVDLELLQSMHIEKIVEVDLPWIEALVHISKVEDLLHLEIFPEDIQRELREIRAVAQEINYSNMVISPLFYAKLQYYDSVTFRMFEGNGLLAMGGLYHVDGVEASGFALYIDECISNKIDRGLVENG